MDYQLTGKVVLVTGAGAGIGRSIAKHFGREGAVVAVTDIDGESARATADRIAAGGGRATARPLDVTDRAAVFATVADISAETGGIDVLVNNAGIVGSPASRRSPRGGGPRIRTRLQRQHRRVRGVVLCKARHPGAAQAAAAGAS